MEAAQKEFRPNVIWDPEVATYLRDALGEQRFDTTAAALARPPTTTCLRVNTLRTTVEAVVSLVRQQLGSEWPEDTVQLHPRVPCAVLLRGSGPHQVDYGPAGAKEVLVSRKAGEAVLRGAPVYAPGVLAVSSGVGRGELVALAVARERPGSDTPEVTRGTTLYDAPRSAGATPPGSVTSTLAAASGAANGEELCRPEEVAEQEEDAVAEGGGAVDICTNNARAEQGSKAGCSAERLRQTAAGDGAGPGPQCEPDGSAGLTVRARRRQRQRERQQQAHGAAKRHERDVAAADGIGRALPHREPAAGGASTAPHPHGDAESVDPSPGPAAAAGAGPLPPGWTPSSQGPVPPRSGMYVGLARTAMSRQEMFRAREGLALELLEPVFRVPPAAGQLPPGWAMLQNLPSLVAALALAPTPGSRVLDMCAAPGGKATLLAQVMGDRGEVVAWDRTHAKVAEIVSLARELGVTCIHAHKMDAGKAVARAPPPPPAAPAAAAAAAEQLQQAVAVSAAAPAEGCGGGVGGTAVNGAAAEGGEGQPGGRPAMSEKARLREERRRAAMIRRGITPPPPPEVSSAPSAYPPESFDSVLLDAPCSALGLRPRLQQHADAAYLRQCAAAQRRLVDSAVRLLRPGGCLVYSTCTVNPGENEAVVRYLLDTYGSSFRLVSAGPPFLGGPGLVGKHPSRAEVGVPLCAAAGGGGGATASVGAGAAGAARTARPETAEADGGPAVVGPGAVDGGGDDGGGGEAWLTEEESRMVQRFDPSDPHLDCIGFFVAKFLKTAPVKAD